MNQGEPFREEPKLEVIKYALERSLEQGFTELVDQAKQLIDQSHQEETAEFVVKKRKIEKGEQ